MHISFGTEGWRGIIAKDFTFENVRRFARGIASWLYLPERRALPIYRDILSSSGIACADPSAGVAIGYDTRFMSENFASAAAEELASCGIPVLLSSSFVPSPSIAMYTRRHRLAAGIMITASHNSPEYNGIKYKPEYGGSAVPGIIDGIQSLEKSRKFVIPEGRSNAKVSSFSPDNEFADSVTSFVDLERIANARLKIISDPIYGSAIGLMGRMLHDAGVYVEEIRNFRNPLFDGNAPVPSVKTIAPLTVKVLKKSADAGICFDGDGDIAGIVDSCGSLLQSHDLFAIILRHLAENRKMTGDIAASFAVSGLIRKMASFYGLRFHETPVGFRHITDLMLKGDVLIGGEESGGIGVKGSIPDKNGPLSAALLLEAMAYSGKSVVELKGEIAEKFGSLCLHRTDMQLASNEDRDAVIESLQKSLPDSFCGSRISEVRDLDGIKCILDDDSWILFRASGTEPLFRIYAEAPSHEKSYALLNESEAFISRIL